MNTNRCILLTGARAPVTLDLVRRFARLGFRVILADSQKHVLSKSSIYVSAFYLISKPTFSPLAFIEDIERIIQKEQVDIVIPTCEETFYLSFFKKRLEDKCFVLVDSFETLSLLHNKFHFIEYVKKQNILVPSTKRIQTQEELQDILQNTKEKKVLKPVFSRFSSRVLIWSPNMNIPKIEISKEQPWVMQEFIKGKQICSYSVCEKGKVLHTSLYMTEYTAGKGATIHFEPFYHKQTEKFIEQICSSLQFTGQISFDFILNEDGELFPIECNPRTTSGIHLFSDQECLHLLFEKDIPSEKLDSHKMLFLPMLLEGSKHLHSFSKIKKWLHSFRNAKDIMWDKKDMKPFFYQFALIFFLWIDSRKHKKSILEMTTYDIEWNGDDII